MKTKYCVPLMALFISSINALSFLGVFPVSYKSHYMVFKPLLYELAARGHSVTIIGKFPDHADGTVKYIDLSGNITAHMVKVDLNDWKHLPDYLHDAKNVYKHIVLTPSIVSEDCENLISNEDVVKLLKSENNYDAIFVEQFTNDCALGVANHFKAPVIAMTSHVLFPWSYSRLGIPFDPSTDPFYFSSAGSNPGFLRRMEIIVWNALINTVPRWIAHYRLRKILQKQIPDVPPLEDIANNISLTLAFQHYSFTGHRLSTTRLVEVGGLHINKVKHLEQDLANFVNGAEHGIIYMSFGSILQSVTMSKEKRESFLRAFEKLPQKVIWKWENDTMPDAPPNVLTRKWTPQVDLLCHPRVVAFISHGGMLSANEAAHCGVPTLVVPFYGDQMANAASFRESGLGSMLLYQHITTETLLEALTDLLSEGRRLQAAQVSRMWRKRPLPPLELAVRWSELVAQGLLPPKDKPSRDQFVFPNLSSAVLLVSLLVLIIYLRRRREDKIKVD